MRKNFLFLVVFVLLTGCAKTQPECGSSEVFQTCSIEKIEQISAEQAAGIYEAKLDCEGCENGSKSVLTLTKDGGFGLENLFIKKIPQKELQNGEFMIENNIIKTTNKYRENAFYAYENGSLRELENKENFLKNISKKRVFKKISQ